MPAEPGACLAWALRLALVGAHLWAYVQLSSEGVGAPEGEIPTGRGTF